MSKLSLIEEEHTWGIERSDRTGRSSHRPGRYVIAQSTMCRRPVRYPRRSILFVLIVPADREIVLDDQASFNRPRVQSIFSVRRPGSLKALEVSTSARRNGSLPASGGSKRRYGSLPASGGSERSQRFSASPGDEEASTSNFSPTPVNRFLSGIAAAAYSSRPVIGFMPPLLLRRWPAFQPLSKPLPPAKLSLAAPPPSIQSPPACRPAAILSARRCRSTSSRRATQAADDHPPATKPPYRLYHQLSVQTRPSFSSHADPAPNTTLSVISRNRRCQQSQ
ncbi:hypothetical protein M5K25_009255 [Dendrobium thyrsiflorum]|uniref:Uncharacterized protein n=1 Tax=Dendrobium thyrsiflorum TaxID=117978 RepID=A0ABD0VC04_DENTH